MDLQVSGRLTCPSNSPPHDRRTWRVPAQAPPPPAYRGTRYVWPPQTLIKGEKLVVGTEYHQHLPHLWENIHLRKTPSLEDLWTNSLWFFSSSPLWRPARGKTEPEDRSINSGLLASVFIFLRSNSALQAHQVEFLWSESYVGVQRDLRFGRGAVALCGQGCWEIRTHRTVRTSAVHNSHWLRERREMREMRRKRK